MCVWPLWRRRIWHTVHRSAATDDEKANVVQALDVAERVQVRSGRRRGSPPQTKSLASSSSLYTAVPSRRWTWRGITSSECAADSWVAAGAGAAPRDSGECGAMRTRTCGPHMRSAAHRIRCGPSAGLLVAARAVVRTITSDGPHSVRTYPIPCGIQALHMEYRTDDVLFFF